MGRLVRGMEQRTPEWHAWRAEGVGSSAAPVICKVSEHDTPYTLWERLCGRVPEKAETWAMRNGKRLEPYARRAYETMTGLVVEPSCWEHDIHTWMRASTDGVTFDGDCVVEIKVPKKADHALAQRGLVPPQYQPQCQHLLAVTGAKILHYFSVHADDPAGALVEVHPSSGDIARMIRLEEEFWRCVVTLTPPPLTDRDIEHREDPRWCELAMEYRRLEAEIDERAGRFDAVREALVKLMNGRARVEGGGLSATRYMVKGAVDYGKVPELMGVDLNPYRKKTREQVRLTVAK